MASILHVSRDSTRSTDSTQCCTQQILVLGIYRRSLKVLSHRILCVTVRHGGVRRRASLQFNVKHMAAHHAAGVKAATAAPCGALPYRTAQ